MRTKKSSVRVGKAIVLRCFFSGSYAWHREMKVFFARAVTGGTGANGLNCFVKMGCSGVQEHRKIKILDKKLKVQKCSLAFRLVKAKLKHDADVCRHACDVNLEALSVIKT